MKLIDSSVEVIKPTGYTLQDIYKQIELAGRTCYKSEDNMTDTSAKGFVDRMITSKHNAMLEHGTVYLHVPINIEVASNYLDSFDTYTKMKLVQTHEFDSNGKSLNWWAITTNYRVLVENDWLDDLKYLCEPTEYHEKRTTVRFICDRGVSHELVRHRVFSFAQESTRYCNYSKDKFGNELTFIIPSWSNLTDVKYGKLEDARLIDMKDISKADIIIMDGLLYAEHFYFKALSKNLKAQEARQLLPNALKTEIVMTGFASDWDHFFELRCAKAAHPDMQKLANELKEQFHEKQI